MLRRSITVFLILAIVISVCVPVFAAGTKKDIFDYAEITVDGYTKKVTVTFPPMGYDITAWENTNIYEMVALFTHKGNSATFDFTGIDVGVRPKRIVYTVAPLGQGINPYRSQPYNGIYLDMSQIPNGAEVAVDVSLYAQDAGDATYSVNMYFAPGYYNESSGNYGDVDKLAMSIEHPVATIWNGHYDWVVADNSRGWIPQVWCAVDASENITGQWTLACDNFSLITTIDALEQLEKNTGETNRLLEEVNKKLDEITDREPDPVEPTWGESAGDAENKEDQIIDQLDPDKVTNELANMHLTLVDNLLLYTNAFAAISAIWVVLIDLPFIKIILYCSLLFGLLAAFLGMGLAAGRASDRHSGRSSGKKGK